MQQTSNKWSVYALCYPANYPDKNLATTPFYIGKGKGDTSAALWPNLYMNQATDGTGHNPARNEIIRAIWLANETPTLSILFTDSDETLVLSKQQEHIKSCVDRNIKLTNKTDGGKGVKGLKSNRMADSGKRFLALVEQGLVPGVQLPSQTSPNTATNEPLMFMVYACHFSDTTADHPFYVGFMPNPTGATQMESYPEPERIYRSLVDNNRKTKPGTPAHMVMLKDQNGVHVSNTILAVAVPEEEARQIKNTFAKEHNLTAKSMGQAA